MQKVARSVAIAPIAIALISFGQLMAQSSTPEQPAAVRRATARITPDYPELAKKMHIQGVVKLEAVVRPNGTVKSTRVLGGSPVLVQAAADAVSRWKFETRPNETTEIVELTFAPQ